VLLMTNSTSDPALNASTRDKALNTAVVTGGAGTILFIATLLIAILGTPRWQMWLFAGLLLLVVALAKKSATLIRHHQVVNGIRLALAGPLLLYLVVAALTAGLGIFLGLLAILQTLIVSSQTLDEKEAREIIPAGIVVGILAIMFHVLWPGERLLLAQVVYDVTLALSLAILLVLALLMIRQYAGYTVRVKLIAAFLSVSLLSLAAVTYFNSRTLQTILADQAGSAMNLLAESQALAIGDLLVRQMDTLQSLSLNRIIYEGVQVANVDYGATPILEQLEQLEEEWQAAGYNDPIVQERLTNSVAAQLLTFGSRFTDHASLMVTDQYGAVIGTTSRTLNYVQADQTWWQAAFNDGRGALYISQAEFDERTGSFNIIMAVAIYAPNSEQAIGVLATSFRMKSLADLLLAGHGDDAGQAELYLPGGLSLHAGDIRPRQAALEATLVDELLQAETGYAIANYHGIPNLVAIAPVASVSGEAYVANLNWSTIGHQSRAASLAAARVQERNTLFLALGVALGAAVAAVATAQLLTNPIIRLNETATRIAAGDFWAQASVESGDEIGHLATTFNSMTAELRRTLKGMEERSRALAVSAEVSRRLSTILDPKELVAAVVEQVQEAFNYYHVHIYLHDESSGLLVMTGGTGEAGRAMLASGHKIARGRGLVGRAAARNEVVLAPDTAREKDWLANPLLPDTQAEIALPIASGNQVLGVLDVQHNVTGSLGESDAALLRSIADQISIALQNAYLFAEVQRQVERETLVNAIGQKIQSAASIEAVLETAVQELGRALGAPATLVQLNLAAARSKERILEPASRQRPTPRL
jgi:GAF domain-containing protein/HAMP domain-containing protein